MDETNCFTGSEKRRYRRTEAKYPICVRFVSSHGVNIERYAETINVSVEGVLFAPMESLSAGTRVETQIGVPSTYVSSLPAAQLNGSAIVVRSEPFDSNEDIFGSQVALRFLEKPSITTRITMFD